MAIQLDHTIVPARDKEAAAAFIAGIFGVEYKGLHGHFAPVRVGHVALDFDNRESFTPNHYAFLVTEDEFDSMFGRVQAAGIKYGSMPTAQDDMQINTRHGGRGVYFKDADAHSWELVTVSYSFPGLTASDDPAEAAMPARMAAGVA